MIELKYFFPRKKNILTIGILLYILLFFQFFYSVNQPVSNLGISVDFSDSNFYVYKSIKGTPAWEAGIHENTHYYSLNGITVSDIVEAQEKLSQIEFINRFSNFLHFGQQLTFTNYFGEERSFTLSKLSFHKRIKSTTFFIKFKFFVALFLILSGIFIVLFLPTEKNTTDLVYALYFIGVTTANLFDSELSSSSYLAICTILRDFGLFLTFTCIFEYFSKIFEYSHRKNFFKVLKFIPATIFAIKYIHILIFKWNIYNNVYSIIESISVTIFCTLFISVFLYVVFKFPKNLTVTFKFFILGLALAVTPLLIDHIFFIIAKRNFMSDTEKVYNVIPFLMLPLMLLLAILQSRNLIRSKYVISVTTFLVYAIFSLPIFLMLINYLHLIDIRLFSVLTIFISPLLLYLIYKTIIKFFSLDTSGNEIILDSYRALIASITDTYLLHEVTTKEINKMLDCSYIFYYKKSPEGRWDNLYTWGKITEENMLAKLSESCTKKRVAFYKDGSFSIPILRENKPSGVIYIGPKKNGDHYLPGEHIVIEQMIRIFHSHYLMYTNNQLFTELKDKNERLTRMQEGTILSMANLIESRDGGTGAHVKRTAEYSVLICRRAIEKGLFKEELDEAYVDRIYKAAPMHDIGKIVVSDAVLKKPGKLTAEEFEQMKQHTTEGERIVKEVLVTSDDKEYIKMTSDIAMYHHEKWNGAGYPAGLKETEIPLCARILAIADVFDALVSPRCYKEPMPPEMAFSIIKEDAGKHFDPVLADIFLELKDEALEIMEHEFL